MTLHRNEDKITGINTIDCSHRWLFIMVDDLLNAMDEGKGRKTLDRVFEYLDYYVRKLQSEEEVMVGYNYDRYPLQKIEHRQFVRDISRLREEFDARGATLHLVVQTQKKLCDWLADHVKKEDKQLGAFVQSIRKENVSFREMGGMSYGSRNRLLF
ncbi:MAG TPA: hemerythrin domain-containing protein [Candidatus Brocadiaceae bacterium]|nr:hemerythrin domain-containing protein [Candidatus Brocadiaceae bacterium]